MNLSQAVLNVIHQEFRLGSLSRIPTQHLLLMSHSDINNSKTREADFAAVHQDDKLMNPSIATAAFLHSDMTAKQPQSRAWRNMTVVTLAVTLDVTLTRQTDAVTYRV